MGKANQLMTYQRRKRLAKHLGMVVVLFLVSLNSFASAWARGKGRFLFVNSASREQSSFNFDSEGEVVPTRRFVKFDISSYGELGLSDKVTAGYRLTVQSSILSVNGVDQVNTRVTDGDFFGRYTLFTNEGSSFSTQFLSRIPIKPGTTLPPEVQDSELHLEWRVQYGKDLREWGLPVFVELEPGYRAKLGNLTDQVVFDVTLGVSLHKRWTVLLKTFNNIPVGESLVTNDFGRTDLQASVVWNVGETASVQVGSTRRLTGRNINQGLGFFVGIWGNVSAF